VNVSNLKNSAIHAKNKVFRRFFCWNYSFLTGFTSFIWLFPIYKNFLCKNNFQNTVLNQYWNTHPENQLLSQIYQFNLHLSVKILYCIIFPCFYLVFSLTWLRKWRKICPHSCQPSFRRNSWPNMCPERAKALKNMEFHLFSGKLPKKLSFDYTWSCKSQQSSTSVEKVVGNVEKGHHESTEIFLH